LTPTHPTPQTPGEIYNHVELKAQIRKAHPNKKFRTESDCEVCVGVGGWGVKGRGGCLNKEVQQGSLQIVAA